MPSSIQTRAQIAEHTSVFASPSSRLASWRGVVLRCRKLAENVCARNLGEEAHLSSRTLREAAEEMSLFMERGVNQAECELRVFRL
jgi:hypothetical protein